MVRLALQYARLCLGLDFVTLGVYDCNEPARRLYEAEGFVRADRLDVYKRQSICRPKSQKEKIYNHTEYP